ncbi:calcium/sodium antiporter [bacterium]|nr:calcium/sodium antiporter [bacterium]
MVLPIFLLILGLFLVVKGADFLVDGSSSLAKSFDIPEIVIGLTIVAFGTSAPELIVNIISTLSDRPEINFGNIIGSNIINTLLILGVSSLIYPLSVKKTTVWREIPFSFAAVLVLFLVSNDGLLLGLEKDSLSRIDGLVFLVLFGLFITYIFGLSKVSSGDQFEVKIYPLRKTLFYISLGLMGLFFGGRLVVNNAVELAYRLKVSEKLIALTIISSGTTLPELATSSVAAYRKRCDIAVGNIVGSNIFNILLILGISSTIKPISFDKALNVDLIVLIFATAFLFTTMFTGKKHKLDRFEAVILLVLYLLYMTFIIFRG